MGTCNGMIFHNLEDLAYHSQEIHGAGYYQKSMPKGYYNRNPQEKDRKPERRNG